MRVGDKNKGSRVSLMHNGLDRHHFDAGDDAKKHLHLRVRIAAHRVHQSYAAADLIKQPLGDFMPFSSDDMKGFIGAKTRQHHIQRF